MGERGRGRGVGDRGRESEGDGVREGEREGVLKLRAKRSTPISVRKPCAPNYDAPPLTHHRKVVMTELPIKKVSLILLKLCTYLV